MRRGAALVLARPSSRFLVPSLASALLAENGGFTSVRVHGFGPSAGKGGDDAAEQQGVEYLSSGDPWTSPADFESLRNAVGCDAVFVLCTMLPAPSGDPAQDRPLVDAACALRGTPCVITCMEGQMNLPERAQGFGTPLAAPSGMQQGQSEEAAETVFDTVLLRLPRRTFGPYGPSCPYLDSLAAMARSLAGLSASEAADVDAGRGDPNRLVDVLSCGNAAHAAVVGVNQLICCQLSSSNKTGAASARGSRAAVSGRAFVITDRETVLEGEFEERIVSGGLGFRYWRSCDLGTVHGEGINEGLSASTELLVASSTGQGGAAAAAKGRGDRTWLPGIDPDIKSGASEVLGYAPVQSLEAAVMMATAENGGGRGAVKPSYAWRYLRNGTQMGAQQDLDTMDNPNDKYHVGPRGVWSRMCQATLASLWLLLSLLVLSASVGLPYASSHSSPSTVPTTWMGYMGFQQAVPSTAFDAFPAIVSFSTAAQIMRGGQGGGRGSSSVHPSALTHDMLADEEEGGTDGGAGSATPGLDAPSPEDEFSLQVDHIAAWGLYLTLSSTRAFIGVAFGVLSYFLWPQGGGMDGIPVTAPFPAGFFSSPLTYVKGLQRAHKDAFALDILGVKRIVFLTSEEGQEVFYKAKDDELSQQDVYGFMTPLTGRGVVFDATADVMREQLNFIVHGFAGAYMKSYVSMMVKEAEDYFRAWPDSGEVELGKEVGQLLLFTASRCLMGREVRETLFNEVAGLYHDLEKGLQPISVVMPYLPTSAHRKRDSSRKVMAQLFSRVINARRLAAADGQVAASEDKVLDALQMFMDSKYKDGTQVPDDHICGLLITLLFAGQHTSSITGTWTGLYMLRQHFLSPPTPKPQQLQAGQGGGKADQPQPLAPQPRQGGDEEGHGLLNRSVLADVIQEQVDAMEGAGGGGSGQAAGAQQLDYDTLHTRMPMLHHAITETLRMHPPLVFLMRSVKEVRKYGRHTIPRGTIVASSPAAAGRSASMYVNPNVWNPRRWVDIDEDEARKRMQFTAFGGGRHQCMGRRFAYLQLATVWSVLLRRFVLKRDVALPPVDETAMVIGPKGETKVSFTRIKPGQSICEAWGLEDQ